MKPAEAYILNKEEPFKTILLQVQQLIELHFPESVLKFKWKIPFYYLNDKPFCYLNASIKKGYVDVAFYANGNYKNYNEILISESRKKVKSLRYFKFEDIDSTILIQILNQVSSELIG